MNSVEEDIIKMLGLHGRNICRLVLILEVEKQPTVEIVEFVKDVNEPVTNKYTLIPVEEKNDRS